MPSTARKRQTRLTFDPLPTSSPAPPGLSPSVRDRAATVRYDGVSPAKRRKVRDAPGASLASSLTSEPRLNKASLPPTPDPTAQTSFGASVVSDDSAEDVPPTKRLSSRKKQTKQKKLDLTPISPQAINSSRPVKAGFFGTQQQQDTLDSGDSDSLPEMPVPKTKKSEQKKDKRKPQRSVSPQEQDQEEEQAPEPTKEVVNIEDDSDSDNMPTTPAVKRQALKRKRPAASSSSPLPVQDDSEDSDDVVITGSRKRSLSAKKRAPEQSEPEQELSDDGSSSRTRKRLRRGNNKSSQMSTITEEEYQERKELDDDLADLASSGSDTEIRLQQRKRPTKKSAREEALAQLKRRRGGAAVPVEEGEDDDEDDDNDYDEGDQQQDGEDSYPSGSEEEDDLPQPRTTRKEMFTKDDDDEGFIIEDDDGPLGAPAGIPDGVPIAFTRYASMKAKDLFKYAIEWMVQKKINPAFQIDDEIYVLTFQKLDDEVKGLAGSKFKSSAWTAKFTLALEARPEIVYSQLNRHSSEHFMRDKCDACNRSGHPATYEVQFQGRPYHKESLEPVGATKVSGAGLDSDDYSSDDDESDSSSQSKTAAYNYDAAGRAILPEDTTFYLGKFCMSNAQTAHSLQHWRFHLYEWVVEYLESAGYNKPEMIVKRDKWSTRRRRKHANKIVDRMQEEGKIKALYRDFKLEIDTARNAKQGRWDSSP